MIVVLRPANDNLSPMLQSIFERLGIWAVIDAQSTGKPVDGYCE